MLYVFNKHVVVVKHQLIMLMNNISFKLTTIEKCFTSTI